MHRKRYKFTIMLVLWEQDKQPVCDIAKEEEYLSMIPVLDKLIEGLKKTNN